LAIAETPRWRTLTTFHGVDSGKSVPVGIRGSRWRVSYAMSYREGCLLLFTCLGPSAQARDLKAGKRAGGFDLSEGDSKTQVLERFTRRVLDRQRAMYATDAPFLEKWRTAVGYLEEDLASGYPKVWAELEALAWDRPELRERLRRVSDSWRSLLRDALADAIEEYGLDGARFSAEAWAALVMPFNKGLLFEG